MERFNTELHRLRFRYRDRIDRVALLLLIYFALALGAVGVAVLARWVLLVVSPYGQVYPHSVLAPPAAMRRAL